MSRFEQLYYKLLELNTAGAGGAFGDAPSMGHGGDVPGGSDFYAPGDSRLPKILGVYSRNGKVNTNKRKGKKKGRK